MASKRKDPYAVALGRKGGRKGGPARAANMTPEERSESARNAVTARWARVKKQADFVAPVSPIEFVADARSDKRFKFQDLVRQWRNQRGVTSSITEMAMLPPYQKIIGMGKDAIPFILDDLADNGPNDWFWALTAITDINPITPEIAGNMVAMTEAWLQWGKNAGFLKDCRDRPNEPSPT